MAFSEKLKVNVRNKAHGKCCLCCELDVEIHHIIPQEENGPDTEDNAAPLCGSCHNKYGANPEKRKMIRERRDYWYEICEQRFSSDKPNRERFDRIEELLRGLPDQFQDVVKPLVARSSGNAAQLSLTPEDQEQLDSLIRAYMNTKLHSEMTGSQYMEFLRELDPNDARWAFLEAKHDIEFLKTLEIMKDINVDVVESDDKEVSRHAASIDVQKLADVYTNLSELCKIPDDMNKEMLDTLDTLRAEGDSGKRDE